MTDHEAGETHGIEAMEPSVVEGEMSALISANLDLIEGGAGSHVSVWGSIA